MLSNAAISTKLISQTQLLKNNTPTILSTHATIEMEDDKGNILPTLGINLPPLATKSLFTLPGYNDFASPNYININDSKKVKELKQNILNLKKTDLENKVKDLLQNSEIKDRKKLIKKANEISKKYKIPPSEFLQEDVFVYMLNDKAHDKQPMTADFSSIIRDPSLQDASSGLIQSLHQKQMILVGDIEMGPRTLVTMRPKIDSKPKDHEVDNDFLEKSQSGNTEKISTMESFEFDIAFEGWNSLALKADNDSESNYNLIGGNVIANVFGVLGFAEQVINFLNNSMFYSNLELKTLDVNYLLKSMIETNLPSNSSLDLEDEYVKQIFEKSNVEKLTSILEFFLRYYLAPLGSLDEIISIIIKKCEGNSVDCNIVDFLPYNNLYGIVSDDMKKIIRVVEASKSKKDDSGDDGGGGDDGW